MKKRDIIVIGASAGGITALKEFVSPLPADFEGAIFIVMHVASYSESMLPYILTNAGPLEAVHPRDGDEIEWGKIYIAPSDHHLLLDKNKIMVKKGPKENKFRPSIDALFRSAAYHYKQRVIGVILSGYLDDGVSGLWTVKQMGGITIIQNPEDAEQPQLPLNAMEQVDADYVLSAIDMGPIIGGLVKRPAREKYKLSKDEMELLKLEIIIATRDNAFEMGIMDRGVLTPYTCPECSGALVRLVEGNMLRFRCHTGHAYTASSLLAEVTEAIEGFLWKSMRGLEEMNMLLDRIADQYDKIKNKKAAAVFRAKAEEGAKRARVIHDSVFSQEHYSQDLRLIKEKRQKKGKGK